MARRWWTTTTRGEYTLHKSGDEVTGQLRYDVHDCCCCTVWSPAEDVVSLSSTDAVATTPSSPLPPPPLLHHHRPQPPLPLPHVDGSTYKISTDYLLNPNIRTTDGSTHYIIIILSRTEIIIIIKSASGLLTHSCWSWRRRCRSASQPACYCYIILLLLLSSYDEFQDDWFDSNTRKFCSCVVPNANR